MRKSSVLVYSVTLLVILTQIRRIRCACELEVSGAATPIFTTDFGSRKIVFKANTPTLQLEQDEVLGAHCATTINLSIRSHNYNDYGGYRQRSPTTTNVAGMKQMVILTCNANDYIEYKRKPGELAVDTKSKSAVISCGAESSLSLYESKTQLPNCAEHMTYALGVQLPNVGEFVTSGMCYDVQTFTLKYANYIAYDVKNSFVVEQESSNNALVANFGKKLKNLPIYFKFMSQIEFDASLKTLRDSTPLLNSYEYDYTSLLQDTALPASLKNFDYIFNTIWWRQLRQHNWQYFLQALQERTKTHKYIVYVGGYGNATVPAGTAMCNQTEKFVVKSNDLTVTAPAYIWAYLKSTAGNSVDEEFVVIAHNSPFVQNPNSSTFCEDICDEIDWLHNSKFGNLRRMPTLGYTFCCRPEQVAKVIEHFPLLQKTVTDTATLNISSNEITSTLKPE